MIHDCSIFILFVPMYLIMHFNIVKNAVRLNSYKSCEIKNYTYLNNSKKFKQ